MATYKAISATLETVARVLEASYEPSLLDDTALQFLVYGSKDFEEPMSAGVSLFPYRIHANGAFRSPPSKRVTDEGVRHPPQLGLDVHFLLTAWGSRASLELAILGWAMRVLEDRGTLTASLLNGVSPGTFHSDETVEVVPADLPMEDMMRIWDGLPRDYQTSVPYTARVVRIESLLAPQPLARVLGRELTVRVP